MATAVRLLAERRTAPAEAEYRASQVFSQFAGLLITRVAAEIGPLAEADANDLVEDVGATVQRCLTGPLAGRR